MIITRNEQIKIEYVNDMFLTSFKEVLLQQQSISSIKNFEANQENLSFINKIKNKFGFYQQVIDT